MSARHLVRAGARVVRHVIPAAALLGLGALISCEGNPAKEEVFDPGDGTLQGELAVYIADDFESGMQTKKYAIRSASGEERWLDLDHDDGLKPGARIKVWGNPLGDRFRVSSMREMAPPIDTVATSALRNGMKYRAKRMAIVLMDIGGGSNLSLEAAQREITGPSSNNDPPLRNYYAEVSYGTEELDGRAFGPLQ